MSDLLSWKMNQEDPLANMAAGLRWSALWGIACNTVGGFIAGYEINTLAACIWLGIYLIFTQWLTRITDRKLASSPEPPHNGNELWNRILTGEAIRPAHHFPTRTTESTT